MPKVGKHAVHVSYGSGNSHLGDGYDHIHCSHNYDVMVNAAGVFYADVPDKLREAAMTLDAQHSSRGDKIQVFDPTLKGLMAKLRVIHEAYLSPEVTEVLVIRYEIKTEVSFAETPEGLIVPYTDFVPGAKNRCHTDKRYGELDSCRRAHGGYSLQIGAEANTKITRRYGNGKIKTTYEMYYGDEDHFGTTHPAARLNAWNSWSLGHNPREIPYTDEAAIFFYDLMHGMASIARRVQNSVYDTADLLKIIESRQKLLPAPGGGNG